MLTLRRRARSRGAEDPLDDARTTPPARRALALAGLALFALYNVLGYRSSLTALGAAPIPVLEGGERDLLWLGRWKMFTDLRPHHGALRAEVLRDGVWSELSLAALYPSSWQEGPGYERSAFWRDGQRLALLADDICGRMSVRPEAVRIAAVRWEKTLGQAEQPERALDRRDLLNRRCAPGGPR